MNISAVPSDNVIFNCHHESTVTSNVTWFRLDEDISNSVARMSDFHNGTMILRYSYCLQQNLTICLIYIISQILITV